MLASLDAAAVSDPATLDESDPSDPSSYGSALNPLLGSFLAGDRQAGNELGSDYQSQLGRMARRVVHRVSAYPLSEGRVAQVAEDVVQQTFVRLLTKTTYDPSRGTPLTYTYHVMRDAARDVCKEIGIPYKRSRPGGGMQIEGKLLKSVEGINETSEVELVAWDDALARVEERITVEQIIESAPESTRPILRLIAFERLGVTEAAERTDSSRFAFLRTIKRWRASVDFSLAS